MSDSDDDKKSSSSSEEETEAKSWKTSNGARGRLAALREKQKKANMDPKERLKLLRNKHSGKDTKKEEAVSHNFYSNFLLTFLRKRLLCKRN